MADSDLQITFSADASGVSQGVDQARAALSGVAPGVQQLGATFGDFTGKLKEGFDGLKSAFSGLKAAGAEGAAGLAELAGTGGAVTAVVAAVGSVALTAANAMAEWADRTANSTSASAEARQNATNLEGALRQAGTAFGSVGDTLANALAPAMTSLVGTLGGLAQGFENSYNSGGLAKTIVDGLAAGAQGLVTAIQAVIAWWQTEIGLITDGGRTWSSVFDLMTKLVQGLWDKLANLLAPVFKTVQGAAQIAWDGAQSGFDGLLKALQTGYDLWREMNQPLLAAIRAIGQGFQAGEAPVAGAIQAMIGWIDKLATSILTFLGSLPGIGDAFKQVLANVKTEVGDLQANLSHVMTVAASGLPGASSSQPPAGPAQPSPAAASGQDPAGDPGVAGAHAGQVQQAITDQQAGGQDDRLALMEEAVARTNELVQEMVKAFNAGQAQQTGAAQTGNRTRVASAQVANELIVASSRSTLGELESLTKSVVTAFTHGFEQMVEKAKSFGQVMRSVGQQILNDFLRVVDQQVEKWAWGVVVNVMASTQGQALLNALGLRGVAQAVFNEAHKTSAAVSGAAARMAAETTANAMASTAGIQQTLVTLRQDAAKVYGGTFSALSQNPVTLPIAAPLAAANAALVLGFSVAEGGWGDVPADNAPTLLHAREMVLPARLANPMRAMLDDYASTRQGDASPVSSAGGDVHNHYYSVQAMDGQSFKTFLRGNRDHLSTVLQEMGRAGMKTA